MAHTGMHARTAAILTTATVALLALTGCSNTTRSAGPIPHNSLPASLTVTPTTTPVVGVTVVHVDTTSAPVTEPPATSPPATQPPATNPPATNPPATQPTLPPPPPTLPPIEYTRGPIEVQLSAECFTQYWPLTVSGDITNWVPLAPATSAKHSFSVELQPQQYLDVIDDHRAIVGNQGQLADVIEIHVAHYQDPGTIELPINESRDFQSTKVTLLPDDVSGSACYMTVTWLLSQTRQA